jgi:hypothetical protein
MKASNFWPKSISKISVQIKYFGLVLLGFGLNIISSKLAFATTTCTTSGVLVKCVPSGGFISYANEVLAENGSYIYYAALVMVVFSGIQYMTSGFSPEASKQAKGRIIGIISGLIFFILLGNILRLISASFKF